MTDLEKMMTHLDGVGASYLTSKNKDGGTVLTKFQPIYNGRGKSYPPFVSVQWKDTYTKEGELISHEVINVVVEVHNLLWRGNN